MRYILDNVLVQTETIEWRKELQQDLILLKLDFKKAYDMVSLPFLFSVMQNLGFPLEYINLVKLLFTDALVIVCVNGLQTVPFPIKRESRRYALWLSTYSFLWVKL